MDIFVGGGGDDLSWLGLGVVRAYAADLAAVAGRPVPNARPARLRRAIVSAARDGRSVNLIGHSWGAIDAFDAAASALRDGLRVANLVTLDPVSGPWRRPPAWPGGAYWLNVCAASSRPDGSDRLTQRRPFAHKPSRLPLGAADRTVTLDLHHWDVEGMMRLSGARALLDRSAPAGAARSAQRSAEGVQAQADVDEQQKRHGEGRSHEQQRHPDQRSKDAGRIDAAQVEEEVRGGGQQDHAL
jgi:pimeloyl-ACP methyl ester carboxylesterase